MLCHRPYGNTGVTELYRRGRQDAQPSVDYQVPIFGGKIGFKATANRAAECIVVGVAEHSNQAEIERSRGAALKSSRIRRHPNNNNYSSNLSKWSTFCSVRSGTLGEARRRMHSNATRQGRCYFVTLRWTKRASAVPLATSRYTKESRKTSTLGSVFLNRSQNKT
uniref:Uncharacterized protein n=1 Tax=Anopheles quadriannulatus TaxID=34691 RepID=A0A182XIU7_ANOQN